MRVILDTCPLLLPGPVSVTVYLVALLPVHERVAAVCVTETTLPPETVGAVTGVLAPGPEAGAAIIWRLPVGAGPYSAIAVLTIYIWAGVNGVSVSYAPSAAATVGPSYPTLTRPAVTACAHAAFDV